MKETIEKPCLKNRLTRCCDVKSSSRPAAPPPGFPIRLSSILSLGENVQTHVMAATNMLLLDKLRSTPCGVKLGDIKMKMLTFDLYGLQHFLIYNI